MIAAVRKAIDLPLIVGGGIANTFLAAAGFKVGKSLCEKDLLDTAKAEVHTLLGTVGSYGFYELGDVLEKALRRRRLTVESVAARFSAGASASLHLPGVTSKYG